MEPSLQASDCKSSRRKQDFIPQETPDYPFDVTLVVEDGKEFKAHRRVLSEASPFFKKLLNSDMRESKEGVVRLEMVPEPILRDILEYIYTGSVHISTEDNAEELYALADYLVLPPLKTFVGCKVAQKKINVSNSISSFLFADAYQLEELIFRSETFILANFSSVAKTEDFLNLSSKEVKMWISRDEIDVNAEEDVFQIILTWIDRDKTKRKKYFRELFREVRLVYVSRDFLQSEIVTNHLVNDDEYCLNLVTYVIKFIDSGNNRDFSVKPRESYSKTTPVIMMHITTDPDGCSWQADNKEDLIVCYYPCKDKWSTFPAEVHVPPTNNVVSCLGKIYFISQPEGKLHCYDSFSNCWTLLPFKEQRRVQSVFVRSDREIYALVSAGFDLCSECVSLRSRGKGIEYCRRKHPSFITKYKPDSNIWVDVTSVNFFDVGLREGICIVVKDNYIYFLGGWHDVTFECLKNAEKDANHQINSWGPALKDVNRYDLMTNTWEKMHDLQQARVAAHGAVVNGKIYLVGGREHQCFRLVESCEVYHEATNEWNFVQGWIPPLHRTCDKVILDFSLVCTDGTLYVLMLWKEHVYKDYSSWKVDHIFGLRIDFYDPERNEWYKKAEMEFNRWLGWQRKRNIIIDKIASGCSIKVFKSSEFHKKALKFTAEKSGKDKCTIM